MIPLPEVQFIVAQLALYMYHLMETHPRMLVT